MTRDEMRAEWIARLRLRGGEILDPWAVAGEVISEELVGSVGLSRKLATKREMGLVDLQGHERGEPLGQSLADLYELKGYTAAQIADELESGRYWAEWPEEEGR